MTPRELAISVIEGELPDIIPTYIECPMDVTVQSSIDSMLPPKTGDDIVDLKAYQELFGGVACGHGVNLLTETLSKDEKHHTYRYETGAIWHESYDPTFCRDAKSFPINSVDDIAGFKMPQVDIPERIDKKKLKEKIKRIKDAGFFMEGNVMGSWFGIYYYLTSFENILMWMAMEPEAAHALFKMTRDFSLESAKILLECGVDCIFTASDLGSGDGLLFSRDMMREYVYPWLKELADLAHRHRAYLHLHSHGHIQDIMDDIVEAGVDIINPVGPSDKNDLAMFKKRWGDKICLHGGISTTIASMTNEEIQKHIKNVVCTGRKGGRFFPRTESGIPPMPPEKVKFFVDTLKKECAKGYA